MWLEREGLSLESGESLHVAHGRLATRRELRPGVLELYIYIYIY